MGNIKYSINTRLRILPFIDDLDEKDKILKEIADLLKQYEGTIDVIGFEEDDYDSFNTYIDTMCTRDMDGRVSRIELYQGYKEYCFDNNKTALTPIKFRRGIEGKGYNFCKVHGYDWIKGIRLKK